MTAALSVSIDELWSRIGGPDRPVVVEGRTDEDFAADPRMIPGSVRHPGLDAASWAERFSGREVVVICDRGLKVSQGAAAWLRFNGARAGQS